MSLNVIRRAAAKKEEIRKKEQEMLWKELLYSRWNQREEDLDDFKVVRFDTCSWLSDLQKEAEEKCINHLKLVVDKEYYNDEMEKNIEATVKSVQFLLKNIWYDVWIVDWVLRSKWKTTSKTMNAIKKFQMDNSLKVNGLINRETINKILEYYIWDLRGFTKFYQDKMKSWRKWNK